MTLLQPIALNIDNHFTSLSQMPALRFATPVAQPSPEVRLIRLDEINEERHQAYRQALANVYATLDHDQPVRLLYLLDGGPTGVNLYFGVVADAANADLLHDAMQNLRGALEGQLPGINFGAEIEVGQRNTLLDRLCQSARQGLLLGTPTGQEQDQTNEELNFQDMDRLVRALQSGSGGDTDSWQLAIVSQPLTRQKIHQQLDAAYALSSQLTQYISTNVQLGDNISRQTGTSNGTSESRGSNSGTSKTTGDNRSVTAGNNRSDTKGDNTSDTRGKNQGGSESKNSGRSSNSSSNSSSTSSSQDKNWGSSESRTNGTSTSDTTGTSNSKTLGTSTSDSHTKGLSLTHSTNDGTSQSDTTGHSLNVSKEITDKRAQHLADYLDKQLIARLQKGLTKGLFHSAVYLAAENTALYQRLKNTVRATFQGSETTLCPLEVHDLPSGTPGQRQLLRLPVLAETPPLDGLLFRSLHAGAHNSLGSLMTADELAIVASLPQHELQGIRRRKAVEFIVDLPDPQGETLDLGTVIDRGRPYPNNRVRLIRKDLNKHVFVTGVTGAGKTTTCLNLLLESDLPFLVIEPAKTEYRELATILSGIDYYRPNGDDHQSLRINPFALVREGQRIKSHAGFLKNVFAAVFPMEASMPMMVEAAILAAYEDKGWDIDDNEFLTGGDPFDPLARAWPTMSDMIRQLDRLIPTYGLGKEFEEKYRGSLVSRLRSLTDGTLGQVLDVPQSLSFDALLDRRAVIELEELQGGEEKALLMALLLGGINEAIRARHAKEPGFRHLTLIEEAHRLLSRPEPGDKATAMAVEAFADMLAEVRKYGEGLIIADQIPAKLIPDIIKNTHTKIVHRLFAEDDRRAMGEAMMMDDEQRDFLPNLGTGEAIIFCGGWHGAAHAAIRHDRAQTDNHEKPALDLAACGAQQLWRERKRYYPQFCGLGWLSMEGNDPQQFARFVRDTRQAQKQLLRLIDPAVKPAHAEAAFARLKKWHTEWQPLAQEQLPTAWMDLLLDANPRPHTDQKVLSPLNSGEFLVRVTGTLIALLAQSTSVQEWNAFKTKISAADLRDHFGDLSRFKSF
ncbi:MAG: hypothetical protein Q8N13_22255 [Acidovorax sp.]|nr:hypothetical protein [Acidovorax sp.]